MPASGQIRVGVGGWTFEPWRGGAFFPKGHPKTRELEFASRALTTIEINGTFYSTQKPSTFRKWAQETPEDFVFSVKAHRLATNRRLLADAGPSIEHFLGSGLSEMKSKLGPILWQFAHHKKFEPDDFEAFLALLPKTLDGLNLRHAIEVRHESFAVAEFVALARKYGTAIVYAHHATYPAIADVTADFVYARLQQSAAKVATGYTTAALKTWAGRARDWAQGKVPKDLCGFGKPRKPASTDAFVYFISAAKERNPAAAQALIRLLPD
ncbi:MAG: DUF72 domain-containing protein [Alphaproteobacteria bacterium]|nr:DUF72 domain-containing protein [Alphaproteobacteria bacterium]MBV9694608.1 DUF72 domain-containing protein [Alphaproteobacteria bacterium]